MATSFSLGMNWELLLLFKFLSCCEELKLKYKSYLLCGLLAGFKPDSVYLYIARYLNYHFLYTMYVMELMLDRTTSVPKSVLRLFGG